MKSITGVIGRDELVNQIRREIKKGKHVLVTGLLGMGKSTLLQASLFLLMSESENRIVLQISDHQAKGQFVEIAKQMLAQGLLSAEDLELPARYQAMAPEDLEWDKIRRQVARMNIRELTQAIIPALANAPTKAIIAVDDLTFLTPTQQAFWLAIFDHAQIVGCCSEKKAGLRKLWWRMKEIEVPRLSPEAAKAIIQKYITEKGILIESPELYISHVVKQSGGVPQAIYDMLDESSKERVINKRQVREMRHEAGISYLDFTPVMLIVGAMIVATRYVAMGMGDKTLYVAAGIGAAFFLTLRFFMFKGAGR